MILEFPYRFDADRVETEIPDLAAARVVIGARGAELDRMLGDRFATASQFAAAAVIQVERDLIARTDAALHIAYARLGLRHGSFGNDWHAYHNEGHILEILDWRLGRLLACSASRDLSLRDICALMLFAAGHDLRQREVSDVVDQVGANERASIDETLRILDDCGFSRERDADLYLALELMIAGSTFNVQRPAGARLLNPAELVHASGALAPELPSVLDVRGITWRDDARIAHALDLALIAADLDTANVAEPFDRLIDSSERLCREREMLSNRSLDASESAQPVLRFLSDGQESFFFTQHCFNSPLGSAAFAQGKQDNAEKLRAVCNALRTRMATSPPANGNAVIAAFRDAAASIG